MNEHVAVVCWVLAVISVCVVAIIGAAVADWRSWRSAARRHRAVKVERGRVR